MLFHVKNDVIFIRKTVEFQMNDIDLRLLHCL